MPQVAMPPQQTPPEAQPQPLGFTPPPPAVPVPPVLQVAMPPQQTPPPSHQTQEQSKFAELVPKSQEPPKTDVQVLQSSVPPETKTDAKKGEDNFPPFPVGEFLKMFPEAKP
jgi:hypothetical protein